MWTKNAFRTVLGTLACVMGLAIGSAVETAYAGGKAAHMAQVFERIQKANSEEEETGGIALDEDSTCCAAALLEPGHKVAFTRHFRYGKKYRIVVAGDDDVIDVRIEVKQKDYSRSVAGGSRAFWNDITKSSAREETTQIDDCLFTPKDSAMYTIEMSLKKATVDSFCGFCVFTEGDVKKNLDIPALPGGFIRFFAEGLDTVMDNENAKKLKTARASFPKGNFAVYGRILHSGGSGEIHRDYFTRHPTVVAALSANRSDMLDLSVSTMKNRAIDQKSGKGLMVTVVPTNVELREIKLERHGDSTATRSFVIFGMIQLK